MSPKGEGTRTLNLRIDSPMTGFVSACKQTINEGQLKTYDGNRTATVAWPWRNGTLLLQILLQMVGLG